MENENKENKDITDRLNCVPDNGTAQNIHI
jgi:hypothetical protein